MDINNIPSTETGRRMLRSISPIYDKAYTAKWIIEVMSVELEGARKYVDEFRLQAFPETATWGLCYWEQRYHIPTDYSVPIEKRRQAIIARRWKYAPMNPARLEEYILQYSGATAHVSEHNDEYRFDVVIDVYENDFDDERILNLIRSVKPAHLALNLTINKHRVMRKQLNLSAGAYCNVEIKGRLGGSNG